MDDSLDVGFTPADDFTGSVDISDAPDPQSNENAEGFVLRAANVVCKRSELGADNGFIHLDPSHRYHPLSGYNNQIEAFSALRLMGAVRMR